MRKKWPLAGVAPVCGASRRDPLVGTVGSDILNPRFSWYVWWPPDVQTFWKDPWGSGVWEILPITVITRGSALEGTQHTCRTPEDRTWDLEP